jgi:hypothetical protein
MTVQPSFNKNWLPAEITRVSSIAEIWKCSLTDEKSLHTTVSFNQGDIICSFKVKQILLVPNYLTLQSNEREHLMLNPHFLHYINHSCTPNVFFDTTKMVLTSLRKIEVGEEMNFFYPSTEWDMIQPFDCRCGSEECLGCIQGAAYLRGDILSKYQLSDYVQGKLNFKDNL